MSYCVRGSDRVVKKERFNVDECNDEEYQGYEKVIALVIGDVHSQQNKGKNEGSPVFYWYQAYNSELRIRGEPEERVMRHESNQHQQQGNQYD